jgi:transposase
MNPQLRVAVDVGCYRHRVAIGLSEGTLLEEFEISHDGPGLNEFFTRVDRQAQQWGRPVAVAMEGYNGYARPLDQRILLHEYRLFNVNNLKLARFKEIFATPSKSDAIDTRKMLELFTLQERLSTARGVLQEVAVVPVVNAKLKTLTRRRRQLVNERKQLGARLQADLQGSCPGLIAITGQLDNLWFLNLLTARDDVRQLQRLRLGSLRSIRGIGRVYAAKVQAWQRAATFAASVEEVGPMIVQDARRMLELGTQIRALETHLEALAAASAMARRIDSIPGYGLISTAELAGEIGSLERFERESSLAMYLGMAPLDNSSGERQGSRAPRHVNTRAKAAMMIAVARHKKHAPESETFYAKKRGEGKTHQQALRALGRHLVRVMWSMLHQDRDYRTAEQTTT